MQQPSKREKLILWIAKTLKQGDSNEHEIPEPLEFIGAPTSMTVSKEEGVVGTQEGLEAHINQSYKSLRIRRSFPAAEWEDNDNHAYRKEETEERTYTSDGESRIRRG